jgi:hypothetical protein
MYTSVTKEYKHDIYTVQLPDGTYTVQEYFYDTGLDPGEVVWNFGPYNTIEEVNLAFEKHVEAVKQRKGDY